MYATISPAVVQLIAPELAGDVVPDELWASVLNYVNTYDLAGLGDGVQADRLFKIALAAHLVTVVLRGGSGEVGPVISEAAGGIRRSYAFGGYASNGGLGLTAYGQQCIFLLSQSFAILPIVG